MELSQDDVIRILKLIDESPMGRVSLQIGDLKIEVDKGTGGSARAPRAPQPASASAAVEPKPAQQQPAQQPPAESVAAIEPGLVPIKAPLLGIFYRRPQPGAPAYVEEGSLVEENSTVALIEVMKLFNPVKAGVRGRIARICAENNALVEYEQVLFLVKPE
jgi:acetyl-CoA carboxylase biotin carboxyl carrier protein